MSPAKKNSNDEDDRPQRRQFGEEEDAQESQGFSFAELKERLIAAPEKIRDWIEANQVKALIILISAFVVFLLIVGLLVWHIIAVKNRPTVEQAMESLQLGYYTQSQHFADSVLKYSKEQEVTKRATALLVKGMSLCLQTDISTIPEKRAYYLTAANYLQESKKLGFPEEYAAEGLFFLGKSLYYADHLQEAVEVFKEAEKVKPENMSLIYWLLAQGLTRTDQPDYNTALHYTDLYLKVVTDPHLREIAQLFQTVILLRLGRLDEAIQTFDRVPVKDELESYQEFVGAQILMEQANTLRLRAIQLEKELFLTDSPFEIKPEMGASSQPNPTVPSEEPNDFWETPVIPEQKPDYQELYESPDNWLDAVDDKTTSTSLFIQEMVKRQKGTNWPVEVSEQERRRIPYSQKKEPVSQPFAENAIRFAYAHSAHSNTSDRSEHSEKVANIQPVRFQQSESELQSKSTTALGLQATTGQTTTEPKTLGLRPPETQQIDSAVQEMDVRIAQVRELRKEAIAKYNEAILRLEMSKKADPENAEIVRSATLLQGVCYETMGEFRKAQDMYRLCVNSFPRTSTGVAGEFLWSEIERKLGYFDRSLTGYERCLQEYEQLEKYINPYFPLTMLQKRADEAVKSYLELHDYNKAFSLLSVFKPLFPKEQIAQICATGYEEWGKELHRDANRTRFEEHEKLLAQSREKFRLAGRWYRELAKYDFATDRFVKWIWRSAEAFRAGKDYLSAIRMYEQYMQHEILERQAEVRALLGQMYFDLDLLDKSIAMFDDFLTYYSDSPLVFRVRLIDSYAQTEKGNVQKAEELLLENLSGILAPDAAEYRDSMFALGKLYYNTGNLTKAIPTLEDAIVLYPDAVQSAETYYRLARLNLKKVEEAKKVKDETPLSTVRERSDLEMERAKRKALEYYQKSKQLLLKREHDLVLSQAEEMMLMISYIQVAQLLLELGELNQALTAFNEAQNRYIDQPESLDILIQIAQIYRRLRMTESVLETINRGKILLQKLTAEKAFQAGYRFNEQEWNELLNWQMQMESL
ncbi:MAG: tetratricopeptide repeat protein [Thermoguttaceae bacterium]